MSFDESKHPREPAGTRVGGRFARGRRSPLYHVMLTKNVPGIQKRGLVPMGAPSNWVKAGSKARYGRGEVYAFAKFNDAGRWAAKWDWELSKRMGSGKVSIVKVFDRSGWKRDRNDPLSQAGAMGAWVKRSSAVPPQKISRAYPVTSRMVRHVTAKYNSSIGRRAK